MPDKVTIVKLFTLPFFNQVVNTSASHVKNLGLQG